MSRSISCITDFDKVTIKMAGCDPLVIQRPKSVTITEWNEFWGVTLYPAMPYGGFTQEDVRLNNERRVNNLNGQESSKAR